MSVINFNNANTITTAIGSYDTGYNAIALSRAAVLSLARGESGVATGFGRAHGKSTRVFLKIRILVRGQGV